LSLNSPRRLQVAVPDSCTSDWQKWRSLQVAVMRLSKSRGLCFLDGQYHPLPHKPQLDALGREMVADEVLLSCFVGTRLCNGVEELYIRVRVQARRTGRTQAASPPGAR
jgi:hypothetical protein